MTTPDVESFDEWYGSIDASPRWDPFLQTALGLAPDLQPSGYLTGSGLAEVVGRAGSGVRRRPGGSPRTATPPSPTWSRRRGSCSRSRTVWSGS